MADEAFALSPISARAAQPNDADYDAIREAFMETSRGRWFLHEYARRNRNADTSKVLDAVARIEESRVGHKQTISENEMAEALASIKRSVDEARTAALQAIDGRAFAESVGPIRKGARVIREIAWRLREIGADGRICDLISSQVEAIEAASAQIASIDTGRALNDALALVEKRIERFGGSETTPAQTAGESTVQPTDVHRDQAAAEPAIVENASAVADAAGVSDASMGVAAFDTQAVVVTEFAAAVEPVVKAEPVVVNDPVVVAEPVTLQQVSEAAISDAENLHDEAVLDRVAQEMAAPEAADFAVSDIIMPVSTPAEPSPSPEPSLGESLIASGIVRRPIPSIADPFASIRRLSQAEKIAFFS